MLERYVVCVIDEGFPNFHLTENKEAFNTVKEAAMKSDEDGMEVFYNEGFDSEFNNVGDDIVGVAVLDFVHFHAY